MACAAPDAPAASRRRAELIDYGLRVQRGEIEDEGFHLTLYSAPDDANPWTLATWRKANPALGDFRSLRSEGPSGP